MKKLRTDSMYLFRIILAVVLGSLISCQNQNHKNNSEKFSAHFLTLTQSLTDQYGAENNPFWLSMWDLDTEVYPFDFSRPDSIPCRVYLDRSVDAPAGATLYWDLPNIAAAVELSRQTGNMEFEKAAKQYVELYLEKNTAKNGIILWGNHYYYDVIQDKTLKFVSNEKPEVVDFDTETGDLHEMRPILPPWELLYNWFPKQIEMHIVEAVKLHIANPETGEFNRHANQESEYAFLESGSILVNSLAFLYSKTNNSELLRTAESIIDFSFSNRHPETGLVINSPSRNRWDQYTSTTEIGLWGLNIMKATQYIPEDSKKNWIEIVEQAIQPWLEYGFDSEKEMYYGSLNITDAKPIPRTDDYPYKPETYADIWNPLFPTHNYPIQFAECCIELYKETGKEMYLDASKMWFVHCMNQLERRNNYSIYAENYARIIHFLFRYGQTFNCPEAIEESIQLGVEAIEELYLEDKRMFRSHTNEMRYDAVDGLGLLFFSLDLIENDTIAKNAAAFF